MKKTHTNWNNYPILASEEHLFTSYEKLGSLLQDGKASFTPRGNGRCYGDASLGPHMLCSLSMDHIRAFDPVRGILDCEAGVMLDQILQMIVPEGWFLPVSPGTKFITVGGAIASDIHGKNHHVEGSFCDHIISLDIMLASGEVVSCSAAVNAELFNTVRGGMGLTGVILSARFRLKRITTAYIRQEQVKATNLDELLALFEQYEKATYTVAWIDCLKPGKHFGRGILMAGEHAFPDELSINQHKFLFDTHDEIPFNLPINLPSFTLNKYSVKLFNYFYYHKNLIKHSHNIVSYDSFFYPLDKIGNWNKAYGRKGFVQYQFVLPMDRCKAGMTEILNRISKKGLGSFLAVFKIFGTQNGLVSFPMKGGTLALDFPITSGLFSFLDELDRIVLDFGGRLYLSKDARMKPQIFWDSYENAGLFHDRIRKYNPDYTFRSLLSQRLEITT